MGTHHEGCRLCVNIRDQFARAVYLILTLFSAVTTQSQEPLWIQGIVVDSITGDPIPFASLSVPGTTLGTSTNEEGRFSIAFGGLSSTPVLLIASLGYHTNRKELPPENRSNLVIQLQPAPIQLTEVEIVGLTPEEVIRRAVSKIPGNYGKDSVLLTSYVRVRKTVNHKLAEFAEAILEDLKDGYYSYGRNDLEKKHERSNWPALLKGRVISDTNLVKAMGDAGKDAFCLSCYFRDDLVEFYPRSILDEKEFKHHDFYMKEEVQESTGKVYHITFDQKDGAKGRFWKGELLIDADSFAIRRITISPSLKAFDQYEKTKTDRRFTINKKPRWIREMPMGHTEINYSDKGGYWCLSTIRNDYYTIFTLSETGQKISIGYRSDVVVTDVSRDRSIIRNFRGDRQTGVGQRWDQIIGLPDPGFWSSYNFLPVERALGAEIEKIGK